MEILETIAQSYEIEQLINNSTKFTIIVSPYLRINNRLKPKLTECFNRNLYNLIVFRENELTKDERKWLEGFRNVKLVPIKNLHAKCYLSEKMALITSMNLYEYSQINNHEIGIKISATDHHDEIAKLLAIINSIIKTDHPHFDFSKFTLKEADPSVSDVVHIEEQYTMGKLYGELVNVYDFPEQKNGYDSTYIYMCKIATHLHKFNPDDFKFDKTALKRSTILDSTTYAFLKEEIIKKGRKRR
jgi:hypothetical protein